MIYTLIGSRETPEEILTILEKFAYKAASLGYIGRSGGAGGADTCLEVGVTSYLKDKSLSDNYKNDLMEVYLPWKDFNGRVSSEAGYYTLKELPMQHEAYKLAEEIHPAWDRCSQGAKALHARNTMQVLGKDLNSPSRFILCYGKSVTEGSVIPKGGTATACRLGEKHEVQIFNLYLDEHLQRVTKWLEETSD